jgi:hypothetical protein
MYAHEFKQQTYKLFSIYTNYFQFFIFHFSLIGASRFAHLRALSHQRCDLVRGALASGYPLHHLRTFRASPHVLRWFRYYPSRCAPSVRTRTRS